MYVVAVKPSMSALNVEFRTCIEHSCACDLEHDSLNCLMMLLTCRRATPAQTSPPPPPAAPTATTAAATRRASAPDAYVSVAGPGSPPPPLCPPY